MNSLNANDLRKLITEVVSVYWTEKHQWLLESPKVLKEGVLIPASSRQSLRLVDQAAENLSWLIC